MMDYPWYKYWANRYEEPPEDDEYEDDYPGPFAEEEW